MVRTVPSELGCVNVGAGAAAVTDVVDGLVAGGCIGQDAAGMSWDCYVGRDAVDMEIITLDFLGEPAGPGVG